MKYRKNFAIFFGVVVTLVYPSLVEAQSASAPSTTGSPAQNVKVVNAPSEAVPVTGAINVGNVVQVKSVIPAGAFSVLLTVGTVSGPDPEGTNYAITSLTFANPTGTLTVASVNGLWGGTSDCLSFPGGPPAFSSGPTVVVNAGETVHLAFPQPFVLSARPGAASCLRVSSLNESLFSTVVGYRF
jgi:hypothetical protein